MRGPASNDPAPGPCTGLWRVPSSGLSYHGMIQFLPSGLCASTAKNPFPEMTFNCSRLAEILCELPQTADSRPHFFVSPHLRWQNTYAFGIGTNWGAAVMCLKCQGSLLGQCRLRVPYSGVPSPVPSATCLSSGSTTLPALLQNTRLRRRRTHIAERRGRE